MSSAPNAVVYVLLFHFNFTFRHILKAKLLPGGNERAVTSSPDASLEICDVAEELSACEAGGIDNENAAID